MLYKITHDSAQTVMLLADAEKICSQELLQMPDEVLKSDIVQVGHQRPVLVRR